MEELAVATVGGTGAVGGQAARVLAGMRGVERLTLLGRRAVGGVGGSAVSQAVVDVLQPASYQHLLGGHRQAICTLGVGQPSKVGKAELVAVDKDGHWVRDRLQGGGGSALRAPGGAGGLNFERLSIFQPSVILPPTNRYDIWQGMLLAVWPTIPRPYRERGESTVASKSIDSARQWPTTS